MYYEGWFILILTSKYLYVLQKHRVWKSYREVNSYELTVRKKCSLKHKQGKTRRFYKQEDIETK